MTSSSSSSTNTSPLPSLPAPYDIALRLIDEAHAQDPRRTPVNDKSKSRPSLYSSNTATATTATAAKEDGGDGVRQTGHGEEEETIPYELHYAHKMTRWLGRRCPDASPGLQIACRAQHFRRWEMPRDTFPKTRPGYLLWRSKQKSEAAAQITKLLSSSQMSPALPAEEISRIAGLIRKENLTSAQDNADVQILEDVACLVFLDDQFDDFESNSGVEEDKMIGILQKTWGKMSEEGHQLALGMEHSEKARELIGKALAG